MTTRPDESTFPPEGLSPDTLYRQIRDLINSALWPQLPPGHRERWLDQLLALERETRH